MTREQNLIDRLRKHGFVPTDPATMQAMVDPAMAAQGGGAPPGMPPGMDPAMAAQGGGMPPGMDPAMMGGAMPPGGDPAAMGAAPPPQAPPAAPPTPASPPMDPNAIAQAVVAAMQGQQQGGGGGGKSKKGGGDLTAAIFHLLIDLYGKLSFQVPANILALVVPLPDAGQGQAQGQPQGQPQPAPQGQAGQPIPGVAPLQPIGGDQGGGGGESKPEGGEKKSEWYGHDGVSVPPDALPKREGRQLSPAIAMLFAHRRESRE